MPKEEFEQLQKLDVKVSRRKLLAAIGMAGVAAAAGKVLPGLASAHGVEDVTVAGSVYEGAAGKGKIPQIKAANLVVSTMIHELRNSTDIEQDYLYFVQDQGQEGPFMVDPADTVSADNTGTIIVAASGARLKRMVADDMIDVCWFGAKGDGTTDDTEAIRRAIDFASTAHQDGSILYFSSGKYRITDGFLLTGQKVSFLGAKAELFLDSDSDSITVLTFHHCSDFFVDSLKISSSKTTKLFSKQAHGVHVQDSSKFKIVNLDISYRTDAIHVNFSDNFTIEGNDVYYLGEEGVRIGGSQNWRVSNNRIHHHNGDGILLKHAGSGEGMYNGEVIGNFLYDGVSTFGLAGSIGGGVTCNEEVIGTAGWNIHNLVISGNTFKNLRYGIALASITAFTVSGNTIQNVKTAGIRMDNSLANNPSRNPGGECAIAGNTVENVTDGEGIQFLTNQAVVDKVSITGNQVSRVQHPVSHYPGIAASNAAISGNMISDCKVLLQAVNCTVSGNRFIQGGFTSSDDASNAVKLIDSFVFTGNTFEDTNGQIGISNGAGIISGNVIKTSSSLCAIRFRSNPADKVYIVNNSFDCPNAEAKITYDATVTASGMGKVSSDYTLAGAIQRHGLTAPLDGTYSPMSVVWSEDIGKGKPIGYVCISGGTPGTWSPFGYIGQIKHGTATMKHLTRSVVVEHGLGERPAYVSPMAMGNLGTVWISDMTATHFTIRCSMMATAATPIMWEAKA
ncbi:right-handed parallel beta-helix repeat-containing protein [Paenibacillus sp. GCM10027626]|uniref:right-handed parallel beta-helix repeat-containing protein n=1 Tax=Paenibacillus sp. GCM10027626 TaxID=3273411 RepID=UPI0036272918